MKNFRTFLSKNLPSSIIHPMKRIYYIFYGFYLYVYGMIKGRRSWIQQIEFNEHKTSSKSDLEVYFDNYKEGPGIWKWRHYFDIYERHFKKFRGTPVRIVEIGIYSGGSLKMWREYFGQECIVYGIDIEDACKVYENDNVHILIGDQSDRNFWQTFRNEVGLVDIVIDDGGHLPLMQLVTLEETLNHIKPGGVYLCEDITGRFNPFHSYVSGLSRSLHDTMYRDENCSSKQQICPNPFQKIVNSIHLYPFVLVIEMNLNLVNTFSSPKRGTQWQPFFKAK